MSPTNNSQQQPRNPATPDLLSRVTLYRTRRRVKKYDRLLRNFRWILALVSATHTGLEVYRIPFNFSCGTPSPHHITEQNTRHTISLSLSSSSLPLFTSSSLPLLSFLFFSLNSFFFCNTYGCGVIVVDDDNIVLLYRYISIDGIN